MIIGIGLRPRMDMTWREGTIYGLMTLNSPNDLLDRPNDPDRSNDPDRPNDPDRSNDLG